MPATIDKELKWTLWAVWTFTVTFLLGMMLILAAG